MKHLVWIAAVCLGGCFSFGLGQPAPAGIHARLSYSETTGLRLVEVPEGPAKAAGLREGDRIVAIGDEPVAGMSTEDVVTRLRGPVGSSVLLEIQRDGLRREVLVRRTPYARAR